MHCDEFRQRLMIDPLDTDPLFRGHVSVCPDCAAEADRALAFEVRLRAVLAQDANPRVQGDANGHGSSERIVRVLLLVPLLAGFFWWWATTGTWFAPRGYQAEISIEHVTNEPSLLRDQGGPPVSTTSVLLLLRNLGLGQAISLHPSTRVRHAGRCWIRRVLGAHLVFEGARGPVTALLMPPASSAQRDID